MDVYLAKFRDGAYDDITFRVCSRLKLPDLLEGNTFSQDRELVYSDAKLMGRTEVKPNRDFLQYDSVLGATFGELYLIVQVESARRWEKPKYFCWVHLLQEIYNPVTQRNAGTVYEQFEHSVTIHYTLRSLTNID